MEDNGLSFFLFDTLSVTGFEEINPGFDATCSFLNSIISSKCSVKKLEQILILFNPSYKLLFRFLQGL